MEKFVTYVGAAVIVLAIVAAMALLISLPVMWLWDAVMPDLFGLKTITWAQALYLSLLCGFLFKSSSSSKKE
jgi:hypothetical protein